MKVSADKLEQGHVIRRNLGYGTMTLLINTRIKQDRFEKNKYNLTATILEPSKDSMAIGARYNTKYNEITVTFKHLFKTPTRTKFSENVNVLGKWSELQSKYEE